MADQSERPERIWLLHEMGDEGSDVWCDDPAPNHPTLDQPDSTEYVRADALDARDAEIEMLREEKRQADERQHYTVTILEAEIARLREAGQMALAAFDHLNASQPPNRRTTEFHCPVPEESQITCLSDARKALQGGDDEG